MRRRFSELVSRRRRGAKKGRPAAAAPPAQRDPVPAVVPRRQSSPRLGRKIERRKIPPEELLGRLDPGFYTEEFDAVAHMLSHLPPGGGGGGAQAAPIEMSAAATNPFADAAGPSAGNVAGGGDADLEPWLLEQTHEHDRLKGAMEVQLKKALLRNREKLVEGMRKVSEVDMDLTRANIHIKNGRRKLAQTRDGLVRGSFDIVRKARVASRCQALMAHLRRLVRILGAQRTLRDAVEAGDFTRAIEVCMATQSALDAEALRSEGAAGAGGASDDVGAALPPPPFKMLTCLQMRMEEALPALRASVDADLASLVNAAAPFDAARYCRIVRAYLSLAEYCPGAAAGGGIADLASCVQDLVLARAAASVKAIMVGHIAKAMDGRAGGGPADVAAPAGDGVSPDTGLLSVLNISQLCARLSVASRRFVHCYVEVCGALADCLHVHYLVLQWHRDPFSEDNRSSAYLHRLPAADSDDDAGPTNGNGNGDTPDEEEEEYDDGSDGSADKTDPVARARARTEWLAGKRAARERRKLRQVLVKLRQHRGLVFSAFQNHLASLLTSSAAMYPKINVEQFAQVMRATTLFVRLGKEDRMSCGGSAANLLELQNTLRLRSKHYFRQFHDKVFGELRDLLNSENWQRVPLTVKALGGFEKLIHRSATRDRRYSDVTVRSPIAGQVRSGALGGGVHGGKVGGSSLLMAAFANHGNPFLTAPRSVPGSSPGTSGPLPSPTTGSTAIVEAGAEADVQHAITSTALNGFARYVGQYLVTMERLGPSVAADAFVGLRKLFDFYVYNIFTHFLAPAWQLALLQPDGVAQSGSAAVFSTSSLSGAIGSGGSASATFTPTNDSGGGYLAIAAWAARTFPTLRSYMTKVCADHAAAGIAPKAAAKRASVAAPAPASNGKYDEKGLEWYRAALRKYYQKNNPTNISKADALIDYYLTKGGDSANKTQSGLQQLQAKLLEAYGKKLELGAEPVRKSAIAIVGATPPPKLTQLAECCDLNSRDQLYALPQRLTAAASVGFLFATLRVVRKKMASLLPRVGHQRDDCASFFAQGEIVVQELHQYMCECCAIICATGCGLDPASMIRKVRWDSSKSLQSNDASAYVRVILQEMAALRQNIDRLCDQGRAFSEEAAEMIWKSVVDTVMVRMVDGFSEVKKCSTEGRGLMCLDIATLEKGIKDIKGGTTLFGGGATIVRGRLFVDAFVKAFYLERDEDVLEWITNHKNDNYDKKHLLNLVKNGVGQQSRFRFAPKKLQGILAQVESIIMVR